MSSSMFYKFYLKLFTNFFLILTTFVLSLEVSATNKNYPLFENYLSQIEWLTGRNIPYQEKEIVKSYYTSTKYDPTPLNETQLEKVRSDFNSKKSQLIMQWEFNTKEKWPVYKTETRCIIDGSCISYRNLGNKYDAHHIIPKTYNGPNEWCNLFPLDTREHNLIHGKSIKKSDSLYCSKYPTTDPNSHTCRLSEAYCCILFPRSCGQRG
jgi:5-methylcytosine-specific restriction endonuclease McrA